MKWLDFTCHTALAACTMLSTSPDSKALIYFTLACLMLAHSDK